MDKAYLALGERRARRGHDILYSGLMHGYDIHIALHEYALVLAHDRRFGLVETVEFGALVIDDALG